MIITKQNLKILRCIYKKKTVSYLSIQSKFKIQVKEILEMLEYNHYIIQIDGSQNNYGEPVEITVSY